jgi:riboflavin kinase/FMN adenylyltransferase
LGVDVVITLPFTLELANIPAADFVAELKRKLLLKRLLIGYNFTLGRNREGDVPTLKRLSDLYEYTLDVFQPITIDGEIVSSSLVRSRLASGDVRGTAQLLDRLYCVAGQVVPGDNRGHQIGVPTANLAIWPKWILPANGVYAAWANALGEGYPAVVNIGQRPTFEKAPVPIRLEAHLLDFDRDLYGQEIGIEFVERLRDEQRFPSINALITQIHQDIRTARGILVR